MFDIDDIYQSSTEKILNYFNANYDAIYKYLKRLEYVHIMYRENEHLNPGTIEKETSNYSIHLFTFTNYINRRNEKYYYILTYI
jgi:hypothetical protein